MRRLMLVTIIASLLAGCGTDVVTPAAKLAGKGQTTKSVAAAKPVVKTIPGYKGPAPSVSVTASVAASESAVAASQASVAEVLVEDTQLESIELLIQDGGAYFVQGFFTDLKDAIVRTWQRFKLSREVSSALKHNREQAFELYEGEIDTMRKNRTAPTTKTTRQGDLTEIVQTWKSTYKGHYDVSTRRVVDTDGVTQVLGVTVQGLNEKNEAVEIVRVRTLTGDDGTYKVETKKALTGTDNRTEKQEWLKEVLVNGSEKISGFIVHRDGKRTDIVGTRDAKGKVNVEVSKITTPGT